MPQSHETPHRETVKVDLEGRGYDIIIGEELLAEGATRIAKLLPRPYVAIVTDENVARFHLPALQGALEKLGIKSTAITLPAGEKTKSFTHLAELSEKLLTAGIERRDKVIALGGGVIGDLTGFAAAILRRGVDFIQIPTTLLAQVDSSVGGKTGINTPQGKNLIGAFKQPILVLADTSLLKTLPQRELAAGYAEVAKYGLLGDADFFDWLENNAALVMRGDSQARAHAIKKSCGAKAAIVMEDETEQGVRALLNLGHTFGHALESATGYSSRLLHGEAVAIGMVQAFLFSERQGLCPKGCGQRVARHLKSVGLPTRMGDVPGDLPSSEALVDIMRQDKKAQGGNLTFVLAHDIGKTAVVKNVAAGDVVAFLDEDRSRS